jgi:hypothetical protein
MIGRRRLGLAAVFATALFGLTACSLLPGSTNTTPTVNNHPAPAGVVDYRVTHPEYLSDNQVDGHISYPTSPPVGGDSNAKWMQCVGNIYTAPVANEHAVRSLANGAVWVTYRPDLAPDQVAQLADLVRDQPYVFMSPYPGLDQPISLQAWGYQLKTTTTDDPSIAEFITHYRFKSAVDLSGQCTGGITETGPDVQLSPGS